MYTDKQEQLHTQENVEETFRGNSSEQIFQKMSIEGTPFTVIRHLGKYKLIMGKYQLSEELDSPEQVYEYLEENKWMVIMRLILIVMSKEKEVINSEIRKPFATTKGATMGPITNENQ